MSLASALRGFAPVASAAGDAVLGFGKDQDDALKEAMLVAQQKRQADNDVIEGALKKAQTKSLLAPVAKPKHTAVGFEVGGKPMQGSVDEEGHYYDAAGNPVSGVTPLKVPVPPQPHNIDPLSSSGIAASVARQKQILALKPKVTTPDQIRMGTVNDLAAPAANALLAYHSNTPSVSETASGIVSHVPFVGRAAANFMDEGFQTARDNARVLATQYVEAMPKSRFQPSTVDDVMRQIAPEQGDSQTQRSQKAQRVRDLAKAIAKRAKNPTDIPDAALDDAPLPP